MKIFSQTMLINFQLLISIIILTSCGIVAHRQVQELVDSNNWVVHSHKVIEAANATLLSLTDAESRLNYYAITNEKSSINEIPKLIDIAKNNLHLLEFLTQDNPIQNRRVNDLALLVDSKIAIMQQFMHVDTSAAAQKLAIEPKRARLKLEIARTISEMNQEEDNLLERRNAIALHETKITNIMLVIFGVISELFIILSLILLNYNLHQRGIAERKKADAESNLLISNKQLQESEERYILATEGGSAGLWDWEVGTDHVFYSPYYKKMLGYTDEEFPNSLQSFEKIVHPHDHDQTWGLINQHFINRKPFKIEFRLKTKACDYRWFQAAGQAIWNKDGEPTRMTGSIIDITERKMAEQRLRIQHAVAEILSEAGTLEEAAINIIKDICIELGWEIGIIWTIVSDKQVLVYTESWYQPSPLLKQFIDESRKIQFSYGVGLPGRIWEQCKSIWFTDIDKDKTLARMESAKRIGLHSAFGFPIVIQKKVLGVIEFFTHDVDSPNKNICDLMMIIGSQIGQFISRKSAESGLRSSESYKTAILESVTDSILTIDAQKKIQSFNLQTEKEFNYSNHELLNQNIDLILPDFDLTQAELSDKPIIEMLGVCKGGKTFLVEIKISKMVIDSRNMFVIIIRDISERKKIEQIKNEFVSVVSHELRTPLTSIRGALVLIISGAVGGFTDKAKRLLDLANNNCERLLLLINDILDIEKLEAGKMTFEFKVINIADLVNEAITVNKIYAKKYDIKLVLNRPDPNLEVNVDPDRLIQVLTNLISNAVKFSPKGETVSLTIKQYEDNVRVLISNKGLGISTDFQSRIFQRFSQADTTDTRIKGGTGLGLNISKTIIEKLGGTLNFISKPNEITTFYIDLPLWKATQKIIAAQENQLSLPKQNKILICEDDEDQANYLRHLLESAGYQVDITYTVHEAKALLAEHPYRVLLLDLILPDQDGISFIQELRNSEHTRMLPIIVISVIAKTGHSLLGGDAFSVIDWLDKPIDFNKLLQSIEHIKKQSHINIPNILHVEDDLTTANVIRELLQDHANVVSVTTIKQTVEILKHLKFDLVILDLLLPDGNAEQLLPIFSQYKLPIIVYSSLELDDGIAKVVRHVLVKSETSNQQLLDLVKNVLKETV